MFFKQLLKLTQFLRYVFFQKLLVRVTASNSILVELVMKNDIMKPNHNTFRFQVSYCSEVELQTKDTSSFVNWVLGKKLSLPLLLRPSYAI